MKHIFSSHLVLSLLCFQLLCGCSENVPGTPDIDPVPGGGAGQAYPSVVILTPEVSVPALGAEGSIPIEILDGDGWSREISFSGCVSSASLSEDCTSIEYVVPENFDSNEKTGTVTLTLSDGVKDLVSPISFLQAAAAGGNDGGDGGDDGGDDGDDDDDDGGGDGGDDDGGIKQKAKGWFELPSINDRDGNGVDDANANIYYAYHSFTYGGVKRRNYTVCYSGKHHCPLWVAAPRHPFYSKKGTSRSDAYRQDPDIPSSVQYNSKDTGGGCNKGHMLGSAERLVSAECNRQVFYYTNIAPQLSSGFNTGGGGWNILEDYMDTKIPADTLYEVVGCYFDEYTDGYGNTVSPKTISFGGLSDVSFPTMFYYAVLRTKSGISSKPVKDCSASELQCVAFVRSHTNSLKGQKPSSKELMSISDLEKITGFTYFVNIPNAPKDNFKASDWNL